MILAEAISSIEFQMSLLLFVAMAGYLIASRINQSAIIGEILVGMAVGPSLLGLITYTDFVSAVGHLGAVILLFVVGMEFKVRDIYKPSYLLIAIVGVIVPWAGGFLLAEAFGYPFASAVFVGTALTATSIAITANVLKEMGKLQTNAAKAIIGAAVIDDVLSLIALSISGDLVHGAFSIESALVVLAKAVVFLVFGYLAGRMLVAKAIIRIDKTRIARKYPEFAFIFAMMFAFLYGMLAELVGLSAIVGAFIAGVALEGIKLTHSKSFAEGSEYLYIIFAAVFFVSLGVLVDLHGLGAGMVWFLLALTGVAIATKIVGCGLAARLQGISAKDSLIIGFGMSPRGEVAMIVALLGLNQGIIGQDLYVPIVLMSLLTTIITPIALRSWLYREKPGTANQPGSISSQN